MRNKWSCDLPRTEFTLANHLLFGIIALFISSPISPTKLPELHPPTIIIFAL